MYWMMILHDKWRKRAMVLCAYGPSKTKVYQFVVGSSMEQLEVVKSSGFEKKNSNNLVVQRG